MIKAIIFDCFGVIAEDGWAKLNNKYLHTNELHDAAHDLIVQSDLGIISDDELHDELAKLTHQPVNNVKEMLVSEQKNTELLDYIKTLKQKYKIAMLSNVNKGFMDSFLNDDEKGMFDAMVLSGEIGIAKPDVKIYHITAEKLDLDPGECVMVDDRPYNCEGAETAGLKAILYKNFDQLKTDLNKILANSDN